jgi:hypothetical protein
VVELAHGGVELRLGERRPDRREPRLVVEVGEGRGHFGQQRPPEDRDGLDDVLAGEVAEAGADDEPVRVAAEEALRLGVGQHASEELEDVRHGRPSVPVAVRSPENQPSRAPGAAPCGCRRA